MFVSCEVGVYIEVCKFFTCLRLRFFFCWMVYVYIMLFLFLYYLLFMRIILLFEFRIFFFGILMWVNYGRMFLFLVVAMFLREKNGKMGGGIEEIEGFRKGVRFYFY